MSVVSRLNDAWESIQVELRGRYSLVRFHEILQHAQQTSPWEYVGVMVLTPLPALALIIVMDVLPLNPIESGLFHQTFGTYLRIFLVVAIQTHMATSQARQSSLSLPLSTARHWWISLSTSTVVFIGYIGLAMLVGFPTPFTPQIHAIPWTILWMTNLWAAWRKTFAKDAEAKLKFVHYMSLVFSSQLGMFFVYSIYIVVFNKIPSNYQTSFTILLPIIKLTFKNVVIKGVKYMEDLAPSTVVFNVDVYHAIFVSSTMQSASSIGSVVVVMVVDVIQGLVAYYEVAKILHKINELASQCAVNNNRRLQSQQKLKLGVIDYTLDVINTNPRIRGHPDVALPQHHCDLQSRGRALQLLTAGDVPAENRVAPTVDLRAVRLYTPRSAVRIMPVRSSQLQRATKICEVEHEEDEEADHSLIQLDEAEQVALKQVQQVLKMLHMIEFYVLIEFAETIIPFINAVYTRALVYLPNRMYYWGLATLTQDELRAKADRVAVYASLELLSLVVFCYVIDRKLRHTSTYQILAFVLRKHARISQTALTMWIFWTVQIGLKHLGVDYSFQFEWLHKKPTVP